jgi:hypothetical protein|tara:strand:- start:49 stop:207 length:159 start_codon:yes stop_codon:yes gene_type:complete
MDYHDTAQCHIISEIADHNRTDEVVWRLLFFIADVKKIDFAMPHAMGECIID